MKHFYEKIQGWFEYQDLYSQIVKDMPDNFKFAEIGVWKGRSFSYFVVEAINSGKKFSAYAIDTFEGSSEHQKGQWCYDPITDNKDELFNHFLTNMEPIKDKIKIIRGRSADVATTFQDNYLDCIFIDGEHDYDAVLTDLNAYFPKVKKNSPIYGHDYNWSTVEKAVNEFSKLNNLKVQQVSNSSWKIY
jgi:hypothetical protein